MKIALIVFAILAIISVLGTGETNANHIEAKAMIENLKRHTEYLSKDIGERNFVRIRNLELAADYIKQEFKNYGYEPKEQVYYSENVPFRNVFATRTGKSSADKIIIVLAHYDSVVGSPGADDNASGVAGLLELSRLLSGEDVNKTVRFVATVNEEPPFFTTPDMGSFRYAKEAREKGENILGVVCLESIGYYTDKDKSQGYPFGFGLIYPDKGNFIGMVSNYSSRHLLKKIVKGFQAESVFPVEHLVGFSFLAPAISFSDHWAFWEFGYKAVMVTDTALYRNPHYHTSSDTPDKLDYQGMSSVVKGLYKVLLELAK